MTYETESAGRVGGEGFRGRKGTDLDGFWTFDAVEERMVEAIELWRRTPGGGLGPTGRGESFSNNGEYATDAPWRLLTRKARASAGGMNEWDIWGIEHEDAKSGRQPQRVMGLNAEEVARRDEASEWLRFVAEGDRELVVEALHCLAAGASRVPWMKLKHRLGIKFGADGLRKRYSRSITAIAMRLNQQENCEGSVSTRQIPPPSNKGCPPPLG